MAKITIEESLNRYGDMIETVTRTYTLPDIIYIGGREWLYEGKWGCYISEEDSLSTTSSFKRLSVIDVVNMLKEKYTKPDSAKSKKQETTTIID